MSVFSSLPRVYQVSWQMYHKPTLEVLGVREKKSLSGYKWGMIPGTETVIKHGFCVN
jgi:hypothetical protein